MTVRRFTSRPHQVGPLSLRVRGAVDASELAEDDEIVGVEVEPFPVPRFAFTGEYTGVDMGVPDAERLIISVIEYASSRAYQDAQRARVRSTGEDGKPVIDVDEVPVDRKALPPKP